MRESTILFTAMQRRIERAFGGTKFIELGFGVGEDEVSSSGFYVRTSLECWHTLPTDCQWKACLPMIMGTWEG